MGRRWPRLQLFHNIWQKMSPVVDHQFAYPQLDKATQLAWAKLDTHDTVTDVFKELRNEDEIRKQLEACGLIDIETRNAGNGVEARAQEPE